MMFVLSWGDSNKILHAVDISILRTFALSPVTKVMQDTNKI